MSSLPPRITVGLPVYNAERFVSETVDSILAQTYADFELVIADNCSTDATQDLCERYAAADTRVRYVRSEGNRGAAWNHNRLVELARGRFFKWIGSDDICEPEYLAKCLDVIDARPDVVLVYPRSVAIDEQGSRLYEYSPGWRLESDSGAKRLREVILKGGHWINADAVNGLIRTSALRATRLLPHYLGGDKRLLAELALAGKFVEVPEPLLRRRFHANSSGSNNPADVGYNVDSVAWVRSFLRGSRFSAYFPTWMLLGGFATTVLRARLRILAKLCLLLVMCRAMWWYKQFYLEELGNAAAFLGVRSHGRQRD